MSKIHKLLVIAIVLCTALFTTALPAQVTSCYVPMPQLRMTPTELDFGTVNHGTSKTLTLKVELRQLCVSDIGGTDCGCHYPSSLTIRIEKLSGAQFSFSGATTRSIDSSNPVEIPVQFTAPTGQEGIFEGELRVSIVHSSFPDPKVLWSTAADVKVNLIGISHIPSPNMVLSPTSLDLGSTAVNSSKQGMLLIENSGDLNLTTNISSSAPYTVSPGSSVIAPGSQQGVTVNFAPTSRGAYERVLTISSNDPDASNIQYAVSGNGIAPMVSVSPGSLDFGSVPVGDQKKLTVTIQNADSLYSSNLLLSNFGDNSSAYSVSTPSQMNLAPGGATTLTITFKPLSFGTKNATVTFNTNDPDHPTMSINVTGLGAAPSINPSTLNLDWGSQHLGTSTTRSLVIANDGVQTLSVSSFTLPINALSVSPSSASISPNSSQTFSVAYAPVTVSSLSGNLVVHSNDPALPNLEIAATGQGVTPEIITVAAFDFENVLIDPSNLTNADQRDVDIMVKNDGNEVLIINQIATTHPAFTPLLSSLVVPVGEEIPVPVRYRPSSLGTQTGLLRFYSNDYYTPLRSISINGTGVSALDLSVAHMEITQAIQDNDNNGTRLIAGKLGTVRATIQADLFSGGQTSGPVRQVDAILHVYKGGLEVSDSPYQSVNGPITVVPDPERTEVNDTLNFLIPRAVTHCAGCAGPIEVTFELEVNPAAGSRVPQVGEHDYSNNTVQEIAYFNARYRPNITAIPISYSRATGDCRGLPDNEMVLDGAEVLKAIYPVPGIQYQVGSPITFNCDINSSNPICDGAVPYTRLHEMLFIAGHLGGMNPDLVYGWFRCNPYNGNGQAILLGKTAFGNTDPLRYQRTFAHEIGHNLGSRHPNPSIYLEDVGFDSLLQEIRYSPDIPLVASDTRADIMVPGLRTPQAWITKLMYELFYDQLDPLAPFPTSFPNELIVPDAAEIQEVWLISGEVNPDGSGYINPLYSTEGAWGEPSGDAQSPYRLQILAGDGSVLKEYPVHIETSTDADVGPLDGEAFSMILPSISGAEQIRLLDGPTPIAARERSQHVPEIRLLAPSGGGAMGDELTVSWEASDADGDELLFSVLYQSDPLSAFQVLAVNLSGDQFAYSTDLLPGGDAARVRVIVTDGFQNNFADSDAFSVGLKAPQVAILSPQESETYLSGAMLNFSVQAYDPEDGTIPDDHIVWTSDISGFLGTGSELAKSLPTGTHIVTVEATDSDGLSALSDVAVLISDGATAPRASAGPDQEVAEGQIVELDATASRDPDDDPLTYAWSQLDGLPVVMTGFNTPAPFFTAPEVNVDSLLSFQVIVTDASGHSASDTVDVLIQNTNFASLELSPSEIDFGTVLVGSFTSRSFTIGNSGNEPLQITGLDSKRPVFQASPQQLILQPQESATIQVLFSPDEPASYETSLHVISNSIEGVLNTVVLRGTTPTVLYNYNDNVPGGSLILSDFVASQVGNDVQSGTPDQNSPIGNFDTGTPLDSPGGAGSAGGCSLIP